MNDDDVLRRALGRPTEPMSSYQALQELRPTMRRARNRRRATVAATAALLLLGGGAGVLALTSAPSPSTIRTTPADENGAIISTLPPVSAPRVAAETDTPDDPAEPTTAPAPIVVEPPATARADGEQPGDPVTPEALPTPGDPMVTPTADEQPPAMPTTTVAPEPIAPAAPPQPAEPTAQVLTSACGDVVVEIDQGTVGITSITPLPGYTSQVSTDGPESVEMKFVSAVDGCEVHAELRPSGLDVEIQHSDHGA